MSGLKAPMSRGLAKPAPIKKSGLAKTGLGKPQPAPKLATSRSTSKEAVGAPTKPPGRVRPSQSNHSLSGLSRSASTASFTDETTLAIGTRVLVKDTGLEATVRFFGEPQFAKGIWVGVELDTEQGKNSGDVKGVQYFECKPNHGLFMKPDKLRAVRETNNAHKIMRPSRTPSQANLSKVDYEGKFGLRIGEQCIVNGAKQGTLLFVGLTSFAKGVWAGVALDTDEGKNDGSVKGERYFTCDTNHGLFAQATKISMLESPPSSASSSLASFETPRKAPGPEVMKPDFVNRTPATTPGVKGSLSGVLRSKSRDLEQMQRNIGDLQARLNEVSPTTPGPIKNGPSVTSTPVQRVSNHIAPSVDQLEQLKRLHEESERERKELVEKMKASENDKLTFESRLTEVAEAAEKEKSTWNSKIDVLKNQLSDLQSNSDSKLFKLQEEIESLENELAGSLEKIAEYEGQELQNEGSAELDMKRTQIAELESDLRSVKNQHTAALDAISGLELQLHHMTSQGTGVHEQMEQKSARVEEVTGELVAAQERVVELEHQLASVEDSLRSASSSSTSDLAVERQTSEALREELAAARKQISDFDKECGSMRSAHETYVQSNDRKLADLTSQLKTRDSSLSDLKSELASLKTSSASAKLHLEAALAEATGDVARLEEQTSRDAERISDLDDLVSSVESDSSSQLVTALKKTSELEMLLREKEASNREELKILKDTVMSLRDDMSKADQDSIGKLEAASQRSKDLQFSLDQIQMERSMDQTRSEKEIGELQLQLATTDRLSSQNEAYDRKVCSLEAQLSDASRSASQLESSKNDVTKMQRKMESQRSEQETKISALQIKIDELETRLATATNDKLAADELSAKRAVQAAALEREVGKLSQQLGDRQGENQERIMNLEEQLEELRLAGGKKDDEISALRDELEAYKEVLNDSEAQMSELAHECDNKKRDLASKDGQLADLETRVSTLNEEKRMLCDDQLKIGKELEELKIKTNRQSDEELENLHKQINNLSEENEILKHAINGKSLELDDLHVEVTNLRKISETAFSELKQHEHQFTSSVKHLKSTEIQLDEALGKVRHLQTKVNDLEEEVVQQRTYASELEQRLSSPPPGISFENCDDLSNLSTSPPITAPSYVPNRIFCDNCDVFDDHLTEECGLEFSGDEGVYYEEESTSPGGVRHGGNRGLSGRPYCTVCEMFGHTAAECEDDMTF